MTLKALIVAILSMTFLFTGYMWYDYKNTGGYKENTDGANGYRYPTDNGFMKVEDCNLANTENPHEPPVSEEWMAGCKKYFEMN